MPGPEKEEDNAGADDIFKLIQFAFFNLNIGGQNNEIKNNNSICYKYFLKIVPTTYEYLDGRIVNNTYQYSVTRSAKIVSPSSGQLPGVFVNYELSPIMIKYIEKSKSFSHFLTSCCAIIGGLFSIAGMLDGFTFRYFSMLKKYQMNKLT